MGAGSGFHSTSTINAHNLQHIIGSTKNRREALHEYCCPGPGCSKLTTSMGNVLLKFQTLISEIRRYFLLKKCEKLLQ